MSAATPVLLLLRRSAAFSSVCSACRRDVLLRRQLSTSSSRRYVDTFQSYPLPSRQPSQPRNADVPDTSIASPVEKQQQQQQQQLPHIHETRPPPNAKGTPEGTANEGDAGTTASVSEHAAQHSSEAFASAAADLHPSTSASPAAPAPVPSRTETPSATSASTSAQTQTQTQPETLAAAAPRPRAKSRLRAPRKAAMRLTPAAVDHLRDMLDQPSPQLIRVGVRNRGCSGLAYHLEFVDRAGQFDEAVEQDGVRVLVDSKALFSIIGSEMDWVEDKLSQRFVFRNPNIKEQCGCGESFMV